MVLTKARLVLLFNASLLVAAYPIDALAQSDARAEGSYRYTIQIAAFTERADAREFAGRFAGEGQKVFVGWADVPGRGRWVRVMTGEFESRAEARLYGRSMTEAGLIAEFLLRDSSDVDSLDDLEVFAPSTMSEESVVLPARRRVDAARAGAPQPAAHGINESRAVAGTVGASAPAALGDVVRLPASAGSVLPLLPKSLPQSISPPDPDPLAGAFRLVTSSRSAAPASPVGGLWISGDKGEAMERLRWIAGPAYSRALAVDSHGRVTIDRVVLAKSLPPCDANRPAERLMLASHISADEGLLLLVQLTGSSDRYLLHVGDTIPTRAGEVGMSGSMNLDNNFDRRINSYRKEGRKLDRERPPVEFDGVVGINPSTRWFNLNSARLVPAGVIAFHELAEAHAKIALGVEYLDGDEQAGAHAIAILREARLKVQRPGTGIVMTTGRNRVLRNDDELRRFLSSGKTEGYGQR